jgi:phage N-6-adenine-methyltransferase
MNKDLMFSSKTDLHGTPQDFFDKLDAVFNFELDVCANKENAKCRFYFTEKDNGLLCQWTHFNSYWMNPPYGRGIGEWIKKAYESASSDRVIVCLLPARTDTKWFHEYCVKGAVWFVKGRLKFGDAKNAAPFPSMVVQFGGRDTQLVRKALGAMVS